MAAHAASHDAGSSHAQALDAHEHGPEPVAARKVATVLVYSSHAATRERICAALGTRPVAGLEIKYILAGSGTEVINICDTTPLHLAILDGESAPTGGMGLSRQLRDELDAPPPVLLLVGRRDDAWLATWSRAEAVVPHPIDAVEIIDVATKLLLAEISLEPAVPAPAAH